MNSRSVLRKFLQQQLEAGESELIFDGMTAEEAVALVRNAEQTEAPATDWRETLRSAGVAGAPRAERISAPVPAWVPPPKAEAAQPSPQPAEIRHGYVVGSAESDLFAGPMAHLATIAELDREVAVCTRCLLYQTAKNPVPGEGNPNADLVCVGEAPGATEDETGRPFVGQAGQLLDKILAAIGLSRNEVFICNVLKHRPPGNRNPLPSEMLACSPYLVRQLELIQPKVIVAFGTVAAQTLLQTNDTIGKLRGLVHRYYGIPLIVTYHPAALLRNPAWKKPCWEDVQLARRILDSSAVAGA